MMGFLENSSQVFQSLYYLYINVIDIYIYINLASCNLGIFNLGGEKHRCRELRRRERKSATNITTGHVSLDGTGSNPVGLENLSTAYSVIIPVTRYSVDE